MKHQTSLPLLGYVIALEYKSYFLWNTLVLCYHIPNKEILLLGLSCIKVTKELQK